MDDRLRSNVGEHALADVPLGEVALGQPDPAAGDLLPRGDALGQGGDRGQRIRTRPRRAAGVAARCPRRAHRDRATTAASPSAIRGSRHRPGSGSACRSFRRGSRGSTDAGYRAGPASGDLGQRRRAHARPRRPRGSGRSRSAVRRRCRAARGVRRPRSRSSARPRVDPRAARQRRSSTGGCAPTRTRTWACARRCGRVGDPQSRASGIARGRSGTARPGSPRARRSRRTHRRAVRAVGRAASPSRRVAR